MTPQTLLIDRNFRGVGRIKRASGTTNGKVRKAMSDMLTVLHGDGRLDVLRAVRDGKLTLLQVYDAYRRHAVNTLPMANTLEPLKAAWEKYAENADVTPKYRVDLASSLRYLLDAKADAQVGDLPALLERLRDSLGKRHARSFNVLRSHVSGFIRATLKRNHPLWAAANAVEPRKVTAKRKGKPLTIRQMEAWFPHPESDALDAIAWGMATTGMHEKEYWGAWSVESDRILVHGTKRAGRDRFVPLVASPAVPAIHPRTFTNKLRERTGRKIQPYDLRRTYANWLEAAGVQRTRRKLYMGHGAKDVTDLYERHEVDAFLMEDAGRIRAYLDLSPTKAHTMTLLKAKGA